jgi:hypothetical protein
LTVGGAGLSESIDSEENEAHPPRAIADTAMTMI